MKKVAIKFLNEDKLPLVIEPVDKNITFTEFLEFIEDNREFFKQNLLKYGGILLRNFPIENDKAFASVIKSLQMGNFINYIGGDSPRKKVIEGVYTSTEAPAWFKIPLHNELSYVKNYPGHIFFYCETPPIEKGQTIIGDARKIYRDIHDEVKVKFMTKGLKYVSCYPYKRDFMTHFNKSHKSWTNVFETEDKQEVEKKCLANDISFKWHKNDWLEISQVLPSVISHPATQEKVWFNQAHHFDFNPKFLGWSGYLGTKLLYFRKNTLLHSVTYADQTKIARKDLYHILDVLDKNTIYFPWQKNDMLILDNVLAMHGRETFTGKRRILTAMTGE